MTFTFSALADATAVLPFYKKHRDKTRFSERDRAFVLTDGESVIAALKLSCVIDPAQNSFFMRSVLVDMNYRHQGLASSLIQHTIGTLCDQYKEVRVICFPLEHLQPLYAKCGFQVTCIDHLPNGLLKSWQRYQAAIKVGRMLPLCIMQFEKQSDTPALDRQPLFEI